jgi:hypothetical protein
VARLQRPVLRAHDAHRYLIAAYDADIAGERPDSDERARLRDMQYGRRVLAKADAWPWVLYPNGTPPIRWDELAIRAWRAWLGAPDDVLWWRDRSSPAA